FHGLLFPAPPATEMDYLSLHDALPIVQPRAAAGDRGPSGRAAPDPPPHGRAGPAGAAVDDLRKRRAAPAARRGGAAARPGPRRRDRKSTRLNSSHVKISYAVFCSRKKT